MNEPGDILSRQGQARSREILRLAQQAGARRQRRRRGAYGLIVVAGMLAAGSLWRSMLQPPREPPIARVPPTPQPTSTPTRPLIESFTSDPTLANSWRIPESPPLWTVISDDQLLREMEAAGHRVAIAYHGGRAVLIELDQR